MADQQRTPLLQWTDEEDSKDHEKALSPGNVSRFRRFRRRNVIIAFALLAFTFFISTFFRQSGSPGSSVDYWKAYLFSPSRLSGVPPEIAALPNNFNYDGTPNDGRGLPKWRNEQGPDNAKKWQILETTTASNMAAWEKCMALGNCKPNQEKIVIVEDMYHLLALIDSVVVGGEVIWARSSLAALQESNYTLVFHNADLREISKMVDHFYDGWKNVQMVISNPDLAFGCAKKADCVYSKASNPTGVPMWKVLSVHFWKEPAHPLGGDWVVSPESYTWDPWAKNQYLGYTIEPQCEKVPFLDPSLRFGSKTKAIAIQKAQVEAAAAGLSTGVDKKHGEAHELEEIDRRPSAWIFAKKMGILRVGSKDPQQPFSSAFDHEQFKAAADKLNIRYEMGCNNDTWERPTMKVPEWLHDESLYENHNLVPPHLFSTILSTQRLVIGIGNPVLSPTPYDALCLGIPFINPIMGWDHNDPTNRAHWYTQHDGLMEVGPPYVYHVFRNDTEGFVNAVEQALNNPIQSYTLPRMTQDGVTKRMLRILGRDHLGMARQLMEQRKAAGKTDFILDIE